MRSKTASTTTSRRKFLNTALTAAAGITFVACSSAKALTQFPDDGSTSAARDTDTLQSDFPRPLVVNGRRMRTVDTHCHSEVSAGWPLIEGHAALKGDQPFGPNPQTRANDVSVRLAGMDANGIDVQALSISVGQYFHWADPDLAAKIVRIQNEKLAEVSAAHPDRFVPISAVALQHPSWLPHNLLMPSGNWDIVV